MMKHPHKGILLPDDMENTAEEEKDAYAKRVKAENSRVVRMALDLEERVEREFGPEEARRILDRG